MRTPTNETWHGCTHRQTNESWALTHTQTDQQSRGEWMCTQTDQQSRGEWMCTQTDQQNRGEWMCTRTDQQNRGEWMCTQTDQQNRGEWLCTQTYVPLCMHMYRHLHKQVELLQTELSTGKTDHRSDSFKRTVVSPSVYSVPLAIAYQVIKLEQQS